MLSTLVACFPLTYKPLTDGKAAAEARDCSNTSRNAGTSRNPKEKQASVAAAVVVVVVVVIARRLDSIRIVLGFIG